MQSSRVASFMGRCGAFALLSVAGACGVATGEHQSASRAAAGRSGNTASNAGAAGTSNAPSVLCPKARDAGTVTVAGACEVSVVAVDPASACGNEPCAVTRAFASNCGGSQPWLGATADGAALLVAAAAPSSAPAVRLMTLSPSGARVEDVLPFSLPALDGSPAGWPSGALSADSNGSLWLVSPDVAGDALTVLRKTSAGWTVWSVAHATGSVTVNGFQMLDDSLGYLSYGAVEGGTHLLQWDGACWTELALERPSGTALVVDSTRRPWLAWLGQPSQDDHIINVGGPLTLFVRSPDGAVEGVADGPLTDGTVRLLAGAPISATTGVTAAVRFSDGIHLYVTDETASAWTTTPVPDSAPSSTLTSDCPEDGYLSGSQQDACGGITSCTATFRGTSPGFGLARTASGAVYVAWVNFATEGIYEPYNQCRRGELPACWCTLYPRSGAGSGSAELVIARMAEPEPVLTRLRFELPYSLLSAAGTVEMVAQGEKLFVSAALGGPSLVEIDATLL